jgi:glutathione S-transferase
MIAVRGLKKPVLWHIPISHYSEKARWALDWKGVEHERRAPPPGPHMLVALWLTRGAHKTFPVLRLDGRMFGDSTEIIGALEERQPDAPLYPADPEQRARALGLEDFFDEELGPHMRLLVFHHTIGDREAVAEVGTAYLPARLRESSSARAGFAAFATRFVKLRYGVASEDAAAVAECKVVDALDRLEAELGERDYLVGDSFTVADLTAASLFYPLARPPEGPSTPDAPEAYERFRSRLADRRGYRWAKEMFARHRKPATAAA